MDAATQTHYNNLLSEDGDARYAAYLYMLNLTDQPVDWAYEVWDEVVANLKHKGNHQRAIATQLLCNLAKSDPQQRILQEFPAILAVTRDKMYVTARHTLQALWKIGLVGDQQRQVVIDGLTQRFDECASEKNCTLIRHDIITNLRQLYDQAKDESIREKALTLIAAEVNEKYRKKYLSLWKRK